MSHPNPEPIDLQIAHLQAAIAAQETLRPALGDAIVEAAVAALQSHLDGLIIASRAVPSPSPLPARLADIAPQDLLRLLQDSMPPEFASRLRAVGRGDGERKQVTVLSTDISGITGQFDPSDPHETSAAGFEALKTIAQIVYRGEGTIDKISGGSLLAVFGAPEAHEDDPERALRAALNIRQALEQFWAHWPRREDQPPPIRIGVVSGPVVAGTGGSDLYPSYTLMGATIQMASNLENLAHPGQILVSRETFRLAEDAFEFFPLDPLPLKGRREPVPVFELQHARLLPRKTRGVKELAPAFVGREGELAGLRAAAAGMRAGKGRVILICADAGLGKSRLLAEWRAQVAQPEGAQWVEGHAFAHTTSLTYAPFIDLLRGLCGIMEYEPNPLALLQNLVERLWPGDPVALAVMARLLGIPLPASADTPLSNLSAEDLHANLFALFEKAVLHLTRQGPCWMVIEDLHWIDLTSLELIEHLLPLTTDLPFTILVTSRPMAPSEKLFSRFQAAAQSRCPAGFTRFDLPHLSETSSLTMLEQLLSAPVLPAGLRDLVLPHADGNPFFIEEILRALIESGALVSTGGPDHPWRMTAQIDNKVVPDTLHGLLMARLDRLPADTKWLAQQAAVIGRVFTARLIHALTEDSVAVDAELDTLERAELIQKIGVSPEIEYSFDHALTQEVVYSSLLLPRCREVHSRIGMTMEAQSAGHAHENFSIIGEHFLFGEVWDKAYDYLLQAGDEAVRLSALAEARLHYAGALQALTHFPETGETLRQRVALLLKLDQVSYLDAQSDQREMLLSDAENTMRALVGSGAPTLEDRRLLSEIYLSMTRHLTLRSRHAAASIYTQKSLAIAQEIGDARQIAILTASLGISAALQGQFLRAAELLSPSLAPLEEIGDWEDWLSASAHLCLSLAAQGRFAEAAAVAEGVDRRAREQKNLTGISQADCCFLLITVIRHDFEAALSTADRALHSAGQSKNILLTSMVLRFKAWIESSLGDHAAAALDEVAAHQINDRIGGQPFPAWHAALDAEIALNAGQETESLRLAEQALELAQTLDDRFAAGIAHRCWAQALTRLNPPQWQPADDHYQASLTALAPSGGVVEAARTHLAWAAACLASGRASDAHRLAAEAYAQFSALALAPEMAQSLALT
jgi:class 3 adenylate cyclase